MNKNLHDMDDLFRSALEEYEETPSAGVKESLIASLDKKDAGSYKKRFIVWKRTALLLLMLLSGILLYESGILKPDSDDSDKKISSPSQEKPEAVYQNNTANDKTNNTGPGSKNNDATDNKQRLDNTKKTIVLEDKIIPQQEPKNTFVPIIEGGNTERRYREMLLSNKIILRKNNSFYKQSNLSAANIKKDAPLYSDENKLVTNYSDLPHERIKPFGRVDKISFIKTITQLTNNIKQILLPPAIDSLSKNSTVKNKKITAFKPFWMITSFASYERAGYRLDSDLPNNITGIKYREIHEPSFSIGLLATRQLTRHWGLQSGLIYSQIDIGISPQKLRALQDPAGNIAFKYITSSGYAYIKPDTGAPPAIGDSLTTKEGKHSLKFISVPLTVKYSVGKNKITFTPGAGIEANFITSAKVETELQSPSNPEIIFINKLDGTKPVHLSLVADAELRYKLNNKLSVSFRPTIRLALSPITKNNVVETFPRSIGVGAGLTYKF